MTAPIHHPNSSFLRGLVTVCVVLAVLASGALDSHGQTTGVTRELFRNLSTNDSTYATTVVFTNGVATSTSTLSEFAPVSNSGDGYGQRLRAFVLPSNTGLHTFGISSDEWSDLFLSSDEFPSNRVRIAWVDNATPPRTFDIEPNQQSAPILLEYGRRYYIEAVHKEGFGPDHLTVRWTLPDATVEEPIPAKSGTATRLIAYRTNNLSAPALLTPVVSNLVVLQGRTAVLVAAANNSTPVSYQWQLAGVDIPGAVQSSLVIPNAQVIPNNGQIYRCVLTNPQGKLTSGEFKLTVLSDTEPPVVERARYMDATHLELRFSEPLDPTTSSAASSYQIDAGIGVVSAVLKEDRVVELTTTPMTYGASYVLSLSGIRDLVTPPNAIPPGTQTAFTAVEFVSETVGNVVTPGSVALVPGGFDVSIASRDIAAAADQMQFYWRPQSGDFDVQVRVQGLLNTVDAWAKAGLMARSTLSSNSPFVMSATGAGVQGAFLLQRSLAGGPVAQSGSFSVSYPDTWLRLQRAGNLFSGFASRDGIQWFPLSSTSVGMPSTIYLGMAAASRLTNKVMVAQFRDFKSVAAATDLETFSSAEPPGPSSRTGPIAITEIMFQPPALPGVTNSLEYIELYNSNPYFEDISGYRLSGDISHTFPEGTVIEAGQYLVVARDPAAAISAYGLAKAAGPFTGALKSSGLVRLVDRLSAVMLEVPYLNDPPWPVGADGTGHSLVLSRPSYGERLPQAWGVSDRRGGSPGRFDNPGAEPLRGVVINEFLANSVSPATDFIELYNPTPRELDLSGAWLSDSPSTNRFRIPNGTRIGAGGFISFDQAALGFGLNAEGETVYLVSPDTSRVLDAVKFGPQRPNIASGRYPQGGDAVHPLVSPTPGAANGGILIHDVVINEILYKPMTGENAHGFVELYNQGAQAVRLDGWRFVSGIRYQFPSNTTIAPKGYLVVARDRAVLLSRYPGILTPQNTLGDYQGRPTDDGRRVALAMALPHASVNKDGILVTNVIYPVVDEVTFEKGGRWGDWANGDGSSLELRDPRSDHRLAYNWGDSDETRKAPWTALEATGLVDNGAPQGGVANRLEITLLGPGECLVDDVEVIAGNTPSSRLASGSFESGLSPWVPQGNHVRSTLETTEGYNSGSSLHLRASARGDTGANRIRVGLTSAPPADQPCTIRARVRWLRGWPEIVMRIRGNGFELAGRMDVHTQFGTPGQRNSIAVDNTPPAIHEVSHHPVLPAAGQPVLVTARFSDPDGLGTAALVYRLDPAKTGVEVPMVDDGQQGDRVAGDGLFTARIPGQPGGTMVAFSVRAVDASPQARVSNFPEDAPVRECLVRFGEPTPASGYATYHYWMTASNVASWINRPSLSNERVDGTFVYGNFRAIYNIGGKYSGSPYHQGFNSPVTDPCHFSLELPLDDMLLGTENFNKLHAPGNGAFDDAALQREQTAYWFMRQMGLPYNYRRFHAMYVNGTRKGTFMEDTQTPGTDVVDQRFPDDTEGNLYKLQPWFEFDDVSVTGGAGAGFDNVSWCTLLNFYTGPRKDVRKLARYRYNWLTRAANTTANDYTNVFDLTDAANTPGAGDYVANMKRVADMDQWTRTFAVQHGVGNWDSFGNRNSQNMYGYKPRRGRWQLMTWDFNIVLGNSGSDGPTGDDLFQYNTSDTAMLRLYQTPEFRRMYLRSLKELAEGPMKDPRLTALMNAKHAEFQNSSQTVTAPAEVLSWIQARRDYLLTAVRPYLTNFAVFGEASFETNASIALLGGVAPLEVESIRVNGILYPLSWLVIPGNTAFVSTHWRLQVPLNPGANVLEIQAYDRTGGLVAGATRTLSIQRTTAAADPRGTIVFSEIMYNPAVPGGSFVEIFNQSGSEAFDLSGWRIDGIGYEFPQGAILGRGEYLVVAADPVGFTRSYSTGVRVFDGFGGTLSNGGEVLSLVKTGLIPGTEVLVDRIRYEPSAPWSAAANGGGSSLQLVDAAEDNSRVSNWTDSSVPSWRKASITSTNKGGVLILYMPVLGDVFVDDVSLTDGQGNDVVVNGGFEQPLEGSWVVSSNNIGSVTSTEVSHSGLRSLHLFSRIGSTSATNQAVWQRTLPITTNAVYTLTYHYLPTSNALSVAARTLPAGGLSLSNSVTPTLATPGTANIVAAEIPEYPPLWINEVLPYNRTGIQTPQGDRDGWLELYNAGATPVTLDGYALASGEAGESSWAFPAGTVVAPGSFRLVWLDAQPELAVPSDLHAGFLAPLTNGLITLTRTVDGAPQVVDYIRYAGLAADQSFGAFPDGQPFYRQKFVRATPSAPNDGTPPTVKINEWMAANSGYLANPVGGKFNDWFELFNPGDSAADLTGYFLSENPANVNQFAIPAGTVIPPGGHLLVWADKQPAANVPGVADLHVNFALNKTDGGKLLIFSPGGTVVDQVEFGRQTNNISMGRFPDGAANLRFMVRPTPRGANVFGPSQNTPPQLAPVDNKSAPEEARLAFLLTATDAESQPADLVFSLDPGAPAGASVLPDGRFRWRPTEVQGPGKYTLTARVTDPGSPALSHARAFTIDVTEVNKPPVFDGRPRYGKVGQLLSFLTASDTDIPVQQLTFTLRPGAPAGVSLDPGKGEVRWTPAADQSGRFTIGVTATDNGIPAMSTSMDYVVEIVPDSQPLLVAQIILSGKTVRIECKGEAGKSFRLESSASLNPPAWVSASAPAVAGATGVSFTEPVGTARARYYRIVQAE